MLAHPIARASVLILALVATTLLAVPRAQAQQTVAVIDMERVFEESAAAKAALDRMRVLFNEVQGRLTSLQTEVQNLGQQLQQLAPGSERALELTRVRALKQAELEAEQNFGMARVQLLRLQANLQIFAIAKQAIADVAQQKNLGIVVRKAPPLPTGVTGRTNVQDLENTIHQQVVLFVAPELDITGDVLVRMDELVRTGAVAPPGVNGAATQPATTRPAGS
jgi:Skp family chaperone for outer membrane proteins